MSKRLVAIVGTCLVWAMGTVAVNAQSVQVLGDYSAWSAYTASDGSGRICFATTEPTGTEPAPAGYGEAHVYLTHRVAEGIRSEFNLIAGYEFAPDSTAEATIGGQTYQLYTQGDAAWLQDPSLAETFAGNIRSGATLQITGTSAQGQPIIQTFSLSGATAASRAMDGAC